MLGDRRNVIILLVVVLVALIWATTLAHGQRTLSVTFLDVGDGLCTIVRTPSGKILLMDCGTSGRDDSDSIGETLVAPTLQRMGVNRIDVAVLSHPHDDHVCGYAGLLGQIPADLVLDTGAKEVTGNYRRFLRAVRDCEAKYRVAKRGQRLDLGDGVCALVLNPDPSETHSDLNDTSIVLRITYGKTSFLLAADAQEEAEKNMIESGMPLQAQVLQVGHHGSNSSSKRDFLAAVRPNVAVISCARFSKAGHPSPKTMNRLSETGARIYSTAKNGAVEISSDSRTIWVRTYKKTL